jgi:ketosteroid isomerase-like protein
MSQENLEVVRRLVEAAHRMNVDAFVECCHPEVEWEETPPLASDAPPVYRGRRGVREWFAQAMTGVWSDWRVEKADYLEARNDVVLLDLAFAARARSSGIETRLRVWLAFWLADGLIIRRQSYLDQTAAVEAVKQGIGGTPTSRLPRRSTSSVPVKAFDFAPVAAGRLQAKLVERKSWLLLEPALGGPVAAVNLDRRGTTVLEAADGSWTVSYVEAVIRHRKAHLSVRDADDVQVAKVWFAGQRQRIELESETLLWESPSLLPWRSNYQIEGLFVARPRLLYFVEREPARVRKPFKVDVSSALAARPDASLVLSLAAALTWRDLTTND